MEYEDQLEEPPGSHIRSPSLTEIHARGWCTLKLFQVESHLRFLHSLSLTHTHSHGTHTYFNIKNIGRHTTHKGTQCAHTHTRTAHFTFCSRTHTNPTLRSLAARFG